MKCVPAVLAALLATTGCGHLTASEDAPAVLVAPSSAVRAELVAALTTALGAAPVALADDALMRTSVLVIDRAAPREARSRPLTGRTLESTAQRFELVVNDGRCALTRAADGARWPLPSAVCRPQ